MPALLMQGSCFYLDVTRVTGSECGEAAALWRLDFDAVSPAAAYGCEDLDEAEMLHAIKVHDKLLSCPL